MRKKKKIPYCIGDYEQSSTVCNGVDVSNITTQSVGTMPCSWRDRCAAFKCHIAKNELDMESFITYVPNESSYDAIPVKGYAPFVASCESWIIRHGIVDGVVAAAKVPVDKNKRLALRKAQRVAIKKSKEKAKINKQTLNSLLEHFKQHLIESLEVYRFTLRKEILRPGRFYIVDRRKTSKYISIYCKEPNVFGAPICLIRFKPRTLTFDIELPIGISDFVGIGAKILKKIHPVAVDDGKFKTICIGMDTEGVALVAQVIARQIKSGVIPLPPPS